MISWRHVTQFTRFVRHERAEDYCRLGWCIADDLEQSPHGDWSFLCAWLCECTPIEPREPHP
jgi:hypothetical protein